MQKFSSQVIQFSFQIIAWTWVSVTLLDEVAPCQCCVSEFTLKTLDTERPGDWQQHTLQHVLREPKKTIRSTLHTFLSGTHSGSSWIHERVGKNIWTKCLIITTVGCSLPWTAPCETCVFFSCRSSACLSWAAMIFSCSISMGSRFSS